MAHWTYDPVQRQQLLLGIANQVWRWDGSWHHEPARGAMPFWSHTSRVVHDSARGVWVAVDWSSGTLNTWEWDGLVWTQRTPARNVRTRDEPTIAFDAARKRVVLFGGYTGGLTAPNFQNDTWEWDGTAWTERLPANRPSARSGHVMAYHGARQRVVLFGGATICPNLFQDTWEWDGTNWTLCPSSTRPLGRLDQGLVYDVRRQRLVMVGGISCSRIFGDTWEWDGTSWMQRTPAGAPPPSYWPALGHDPGRGRTVWFAGAELWEWDGQAWQRAATGPPGGSDASMAYDSSRNRAVYFGVGNGSGSGSGGDTWEYGPAGWEQRSGPGPSGRHHAAMAYDAARQRTVLFGGDPGFGDSDETWEWDGTLWRQPALAIRPPRRVQHAMAYDAMRQRVVLFGGQSGGTPLDDTWEWDGSAWRLLLPNHNPPAGGGGGMAFDSARGRTVLVDAGGIDELWEWDGTDWSKQSVAPPAGIEVEAVVFDVDRQRTVVYAGSTVSSSGKTYEWDGTTWSTRTSFGIPYGDGMAAAYDLARRVTVALDVRAGTWHYGPLQPASVTAFGAGCPGAVGVPRLTASLPWAQPGASVSFTLASLPAGSTAAQLLGVSATTWGGVPLPLQLSSAGMPGCELLVSPDLTLGLSAAGGTATTTLPLTNNALAGHELYSQGAGLDASANTAGVVWSNGVALRIGAK